MFIKICGTTNLLDAQLSVQLGADGLGFIFAPSKRRVTVEQAAAITQSLPRHIERIGVFTEADPQGIAHAVQVTGLSAVQMHWPYDPERIRILREALRPEVMLWQVVGVPIDSANGDAAGRTFSHLLRAAMHDARLAVVLLDTVKNGASGGLGETFPWSGIQPVLNTARSAASQGEQRGREAFPRTMLAGGLRAENVREAIAEVRPSGVDVVSGVEASAGVKSADRLQAFVEAVREAEAGLPQLP